MNLVRYCSFFLFWIETSFSNLGLNQVAVSLIMNFYRCYFCFQSKPLQHFLNFAFSFQSHSEVSPSRYDSYYRPCYGKDLTVSFMNYFMNLIGYSQACYCSLQMFPILDLYPSPSPITYFEWFLHSFGVSKWKLRESYYFIRIGGCHTFVYAFKLRVVCSYNCLMPFRGKFIFVTFLWHHFICLHT